MIDRARDEREPREGDFAQVAKSVVDEATRDREADLDLAGVRQDANDEREAERLRADPATWEWVAETRESIKAGAFDAEIRDQLSPAEEIAKLKARR